jgi:hypothetical protein
MRFYLPFEILAVLSCLTLVSACNSESEQSKPIVKFASVIQSDWNVAGKKFYLINLSMRKIDSLSAELNLKFTIKNAQGL